MKIKLLSVALLLLSGCSSIETQSPEIDLPLSWNKLSDQESVAVGSAVDNQWWKQFGDQTLTELIEESLKNNKGLLISKARIAEVRANRRVVNSGLFPDISGRGGWSRGDNGALTQNRIIDTLDVGMQASWELDLWGQNRSRSRQAQALLESQEAQMQAVRIALLSEVARSYFDLRNYERQIVIAERNLEAQNKTLEVTKSQFEAAMVGALDVERAGAQVSTTEAQLASFRSAYETSRNSLTVLSGLMPGSRNELLGRQEDLRELDQKIIISAPAEILARRPDIIAAERLFAAGLSEKDVATAELFPKISLLAMFGAQDSNIGAGSPWTLAANIAQPVLNFGRIQGGIDAADARAQQSFLAYQQTVLEALGDMENALVRYAYEGQRKESLARAVKQNQHSVQIAEEQFRNGFINLLDLLVAQRQLLTSESDLSASDIQLRKNIVAIYAAAGGGWGV